MQKTFQFKIKAWLLVVLAIGIMVSVIGGLLYAIRGNLYGLQLHLPQVPLLEKGLVYGAWPALANADFFERVKTDFIAQKQSFIEADLSAMTLRVYHDGVQVAQVPIKSKGREGSWWETPSGLYKAEAKEKSHFSSLGRVYMPWSIPFQGNFFIHGWPYYPDGTEVSSNYSGGCIRLATEDAKIVYDLTNVGMPILVFEKDFARDNFKYQTQGPQVKAKSYLVADIKSNFVLSAHNSQEAIETTIIPKLMTALVASEYQDIEKQITVIDEMLVTTWKPRLSSGEVYTIYDLLFPLLLEDSAEAAEAMSYSMGSSRFVSLMEVKAQALGMSETTFADQSGIAEGNITTAEDIFQIAKYLYNNRPFLLNMSAQKSQTHVYGEPAFTDINPIHPLIGTQSFLGGLIQGEERGAPLTEQTDERDMFALVTMQFGGVERPILFVVLDSSDPALDLGEMISFVQQTYQ